MPGRHQKVWLALGGLALMSGCAGYVQNVAADLEYYSSDIELVDVPFHSQITDQCGPAALATILNVTGADVTPELLKRQIYIPGRRGSIQAEIVAATRHYQRVPYTIDPDIKALMAELSSGRPVLILQNLGTRLVPLWHYAVVVGYLPDDEKFVLRSGNKKRHVIDSRQFIRSWQRAAYWGLVALRPDELPARPTAKRYLRSVAAIEAVGHATTAVSAYRTATAQWPSNELAWLGLGNASYSSGQMPEAVNAYQMLLEINSHNAIALNNLALVYFEQNCYLRARATIEAALSAVSRSDPIYPDIWKTWQDIDSQEPWGDCIQ